MASTNNKKEGTKPAVHLYDKDTISNLIRNVKLISKSDQISTNYDKENELDIKKTDQKYDNNVEDIDEDQSSCSYCPGTIFTCLSDQRLHYKLDWHRYNLKKSLQGKQSLPEEQFEKILEDLENDEENEISGSDDEDSDDYNNSLDFSQNPRLILQSEDSTFLSVFKCLLYDRKTRDTPSDVEILNLIQGLTKRLTWAIFMLGGGHFAGAVFRGNEVLVHKTFHCYTVRAKQGGSQGSADNKSGSNHPKSAGASLRRYNEMSLMQHIQEITKNWEDHINSSQLIFYRATSSNKNAMFSGKNSVLNKNDERLRTIPFPTKRATFNEVKRVHEMLCRVEIYNDLEELEKATCIPKSPVKQKRTHHRSKSREEVKRELPGTTADTVDNDSNLNDNSTSLEFDQISMSTQHLKEFENTTVQTKGKRSKNHKGNGISKDLNDLELESDSEDDADSKDRIRLQNELLTAVQSGSTGLLDNWTTYVRSRLEHQEEELNLTVELLVNHQFGESKSTVLHQAAKQGLFKLVWNLLLLGADPTIRDKMKKVPFLYASDKETRNSFRRYSGENPDKHDYKSASIPPPLSKEAEEEKARKISEKKKAQRIAKREKDKVMKADEKKVSEEKADKDRFLNLSDREKRALAAERRFMGSGQTAGIQKQLCFQCASDVTGKTPFEYGDNKFCSVGCVKKHRAAHA